MRRLLVIILLPLVWACSSETKEKKMELYVGSYTEKLGHVDGNAKGVSMCQFNPETGKITKAELKIETPNPSYIAFHPSGNILYAVNEKGGKGDFDFGSVIAFRKNASTGEYTKLNEVSSGGKYPCYVSVSEDGNYLFTANYGGGLAMHVIHEDGHLGKNFFSLTNDGKGTHPRQEASHIHMAYVVGKTVWVTDLGTDLVSVYDINRQNNALELKQEINLPSASGPRHLAVSAQQDFVYVVNELNATVNLLKKDTASVWTVSATYPTLKSGAGDGACGDIHLSADNRFLYLSNRGEHNIISVFAVNGDSGELTPVQEIASGGKTPRNFVISPDGKFLLAANQDSRDIVVFSIDKESGKLAQKHKLATTTPVCLKFLPQATL